jgi:hypothetical protein
MDIHVPQRLPGIGARYELASSDDRLGQGQAATPAALLS